MQMNVNRRQLCVWGAPSVLLWCKRCAHPLCELNGRLWFMSRLHLSLLLLFWKGTLDLIWHVGGRGPVSGCTLNALTDAKASGLKKSSFLWKSTRGTISVVLNCLRGDWAGEGRGLLLTSEQQTASRARSVMRSSGLGAG